MVPSQVRLEECARGRSARRGRGRRRSAAASRRARAAISLARFSASVAPGPAYRAVRTPGRAVRAPPPRCRSRRRSPGVRSPRRARRGPSAARWRRRSSPSSGGELDAPGSGSSATPPSRRANSRSLCVVARGEDEPHGAGHRVAAAWTSRSAVDAVLGEREQLVEVGAGQRRALGGRLDLDQPALAGHHHVGVDLGARVLGVVEVEQRDAVDDAAGDRGDRAGERHGGRVARRRPAGGRRARARRSRR